MSPVQILFAISTVFLISLQSCDERTESVGCTDLETAYELVWSDEFDGTTIDPAAWAYDLADGCDRGICGWGNNELQYYTDAAENAWLEDGQLILQAQRETPPIRTDSLSYVYSSARLVTRGQLDWRYGKIEARARMPIGKGLWPAIWMLPSDYVYGGWPRSGEIDIMEYVGDKPEEVFGTIHYGHDGWRFNSNPYTLKQGNFHEEFHTFTITWAENCIQWYVDEQLYATETRTDVLPTTWPFDQNFHLIINMAVGGNLPGAPDASTRFPQRMEIDYIRVYQ